MNIVSQAYLEGISEGRSFLKSNPDMTVIEMKRARNDCTELMRSHSDVTKEAFKGERDFWSNQIKRVSIMGEHKKVKL